MRSQISYSADIDAVARAVLSCHTKGLFSMKASALHHRFSYFCTLLVADDKEKTIAWRYGVSTNLLVNLDARLDFIALQLDATLQQAKTAVRRLPQLASNTSVTRARTACHATAQSWAISQLSQGHMSEAV